jgi:hypothetical protein
LKRLQSNNDPKDWGPIWVTSPGALAPHPKRSFYKKRLHALNLHRGGSLRL